MVHHKILRRGALPAIIVLSILIPFALFGAQIEMWSERVLADSNVTDTVIALVVIGLLAGDVLLPIPSSLASLLAGAKLGVLAGAVTIWLGMTLGCALGWAVGRGVFSPIARAIDQDTAQQDAPSIMTLILFRPIPVLAEMSILLAGGRGVSFPKTMLICGVTNLPIAMLYASFGAQLLGEVPMPLLIVVVLLLTAIARLLPKDQSI